MNHRYHQTFGDFKCIHCKQYVSADVQISGVNNRNHCPYCLHSRHLDLYEAGDRLAACKEQMRPIGLTVKKARKKYGKDQGELMLVHQCTECGKVSINRIAADDLADTLYETYLRSLALNRQDRQALEQSGIELLSEADSELVRLRLFGWHGQPSIRPAAAVPC